MNLVEQIEAYLAEHSQVRIEGFARMFGYKRDTVNKWLRGYNHISGEAKRKLEIFFDTGVAVKRPEPEPTGNDLIDRIKMFIWKHNMDNAEFYTACGIPKATYDNWMSGRNAPSVKNIVRLEKFLVWEEEKPLGNSFHERLESYRRENKLTIMALAKRLGYADTTVGYWLRGAKVQKSALEKVEAFLANEASKAEDIALKSGDIVDES